MPTETTPEKTTKTPLIEEHKPYVFPFTLGADPEFTVISGTRPMNAQDIFSTFFKELKQADHGYKLPGGNIGWDNHPATGELRPKPGSPLEVVANLKLLLAESHKRMPFVDLTTLTVAASTGGHIHLSVPEELNNAAANKTPKWAAIERAIGTFLLMIMLGENTLSQEMRKRGGNYGDLLDFRIEPKFKHASGQNGLTLEVRGPTAEWITSEKIAIGTLAYMAIAWDSILKESLAPIASVIFRNKLQAHDTVTPLMNNFANMQKLYLNKIRPFIRSHPAYKDYRMPLELIMSPERVIAEKKRVHYSINEGWGFALESKSIPTNKFLNDEAIEEATAKFPEQVIRNLSQFAWNEDLHVEQFATGLSKRCIALGWKPQHEYFLFGMKKGLDALVMRDEEGNFVAGTEIIKTKEDLNVIEKKFQRLTEKAVPVYGRMLHPRTGELVKERDSRRVMVGIPYAMRRKGDIKPLIRLVLRFEKNPKAFSAITPSNLPDGAGILKKILQKEEELEHGVNEALRRGEKTRQLPDDLREAAQEELQRQEPETRDSQVVLSRESLTMVINQIDWLTHNLRSNYTEFRQEEIGNLLSHLIGERQEWPGVPNIDTYQAIFDDLVTIITRMVLPGEMENEEIIEGCHSGVAYLLCEGIGEQTEASIEDGQNHFNHQVTFNPDRGGLFVFHTSTRTEARPGRTQNGEIILDMLGINNPTDRLMIEDMLRSNPGQRYQFTNQTGPTTTPIGRISPMSENREETIFINPDMRMPHVWNA